MKTTCVVAILLTSFSVFSSNTKSEIMASVDFYKGKNKKLAHLFEIEKNKIDGHYSFNLSLKGIKNKKLTQEQAFNIKSEINNLVWDFVYKSKKENKKCKKIYAVLKVNEDSVTICSEDKKEVYKTFSLLNRLNNMLR